MANGIHSVLIYPQVDGSVVDKPDFLTGSNLVLKGGGICVSSKEGVTRIYGFDDRRGFDKLSHAKIDFLLLLPLTFPVGHDVVSQVSKTLKTFHGGTSDIIHTASIVTAVQLLTIGETPFTPVPKTTQELEDHVDDLIKAIQPSNVDQGSGICLSCQRPGYVGLEAGLPPAADVLATRAIP